MSSRPLVTDVELQFENGDLVSFTLAESAPAVLTRIHAGEKSYTATRPDGLLEVHVVRWADVRYCKVTQRYAETPSPTYVGEGVSVSGELPGVD